VLALKGVHVRIVDRLAEGANTSRAAVVHAATLEALEQIGVSDRLEARGLKCTTFSVRDRDEVLLPVDFSNLPTKYPFTLMVSQAVTEAVLLERLRELNIEVGRGRSFAHYHQDSNGVTTTLDNGEQIRSRYLVAADGMHSEVRKLAGIGFTGDTYGQSFLLADVRLKGVVPRDEVILYFSPAGLVVMAPLPDGIHRIVATVDEAPPTPSAADIQSLLNTRGPSRVSVDSVLWGSRFRVHHRLAERYRKGRVLLAGDAAHVHSPAGGQGMNTGIQDAVALANALLSALRIDVGSVLDAYETERRPVAEGVLALADRLTRVATVRSSFAPLRNFAVRTLARSARFRTRLAWQLAGLHNRPRSSSGPVSARTQIHPIGRRAVT
jgi:2-polyprenyl-6-methoxyphenol hydroxylase-like FAD-dependent oxidoreductase